MRKSFADTLSAGVHVQLATLGTNLLVLRSFCY